MRGLTRRLARISVIAAILATFLFTSSPASAQEETFSNVNERWYAEITNLDPSGPGFIQVDFIPDPASTCPDPEAHIPFGRIFGPLELGQTVTTEGLNFFLTGSVPEGGVCWMGSVHITSTGPISVDVDESPPFLYFEFTGVSYAGFLEFVSTAPQPSVARALVIPDDPACGGPFGFEVNLDGGGFTVPIASFISPACGTASIRVVGIGPFEVIVGQDPVAQLVLLEFQVSNLSETQGLSEPHENNLARAVGNALTADQDGDEAAAMRWLTVFSNQVRALVHAGKLDATLGAELIATAQDIASSL